MEIQKRTEDISLFVTPNSKLDYVLQRTSAHCISHSHVSQHVSMLQPEHITESNSLTKLSIILSFEWLAPTKNMINVVNHLFHAEWPNNFPTSNYEDFIDFVGWHWSGIIVLLALVLLGKKRMFLATGFNMEQKMYIFCAPAFPIACKHVYCGLIYADMDGAFTNEQFLHIFVPSGQILIFTKSGTYNIW